MDVNFNKHPVTERENKIHSWTFDAIFNDTY